MAGGAVTFTNSTLSGSSTSGGAAASGGMGGNHGGTASQGHAGSAGGADGGGLFVSGGNFTSVNSTIAYNNVASGGTGGGLDGLAGTVTIDNTIVALNTNGTGSGAPADDIAGTVASASAFNLIGTGGAGGLSNGTNGNKVGVADPGLGTLANNGGPTETIALLAGSPAIDAGSNALAVDPSTGSLLTTDQRGPGFPRIVNGTVDIGAFEVQSTIGLIATVQPPGTNTAGVGFGFTVTAEDHSGNTDSSFNGVVTVALATNPGGATLGGTLTATAQDGVASFSGLTLNKSGNGYTLLVSASGVASGATAAFDITPATATQLVVTAQPSAVFAGNTFDVTVAAEDPFDNVDTNFDGSVTVALGVNPGQATLGGTLTETAQSGVASFSDLTLDQAGIGYTLQLSSNGLTSATTNPFNVTIAQLVVTVQPPTSVAAGDDFSLTVTAEDSSGNVDTSFDGVETVAVSTNPGGATLGGVLMVTAQDGVATFSGLTLSNSGTGYTLQISADNTTAATTDPFNVTVPQLVVTAQPPASILAGADFSVTVTVENSSGNVDTSFNGTETLALSTNPGAAALGGTVTATAQNGVATFSGLTLSQPGTGYTLVVSGPGPSTVTTDSFNVQTGIVGTSVTWGTQTAALQTASDGLHLLPTGRNTDVPWLGIDQFTITLSQAATLSAGDVTVTGIAVANYGPVTVSGSGTSYTITLAQPIDQADRVTITIGNANIATFTRELVVLPGDFNDDGVVNSQDLVGVRNEWLGIGGASYTIFGDLNGDGVVNVTDYNDVRAFLGTSLPSAAPSNLLVNGNFSLGNTGFTSQYVYSTNLEPEGNYVVGANPHDFHPGGASFGDHTTGTGLMLIANGAPTPNTVLWQETVNVSPGTGYAFSGWAASWGELGNGIDPSPAQLEFFVNGVQIGTEFTLIAQDGQWSQFTANWSSGTSNSATITIVDENLAPTGNDFAVDDLVFGLPGPIPPALMVTAQPGSVIAGDDFGLTVTAENSSGNADTSFDGTVTVALSNNPGGSALGGTLTATAHDGVANFSDLTLNKVGTDYTLVVSASNASGATTDGIDVTPAAATQLIVTSQPPGSVLTGSPFGLTVTAEDPFDNVDTNFGGSVTVALLNNPGGATLGGTLMATAHDGVAAFSGLTLDQPANGYTLLVSSTGLTSATTDAVDVTVPQLVVTAQPPGSVTVGSDFGLTVTAEDSSGNVDPSFTGTVTVALSNNPGGATLGGTLTATAHDGVASFSDLTLDQPGIGYTLEVSASGLASVTTNSFNVQTTVNSSVGVAWGPSATATLETASDGLHLLPAGRNTDVPWLGIDQFTITLAQATTLAAGDVTVGSAVGASYGPVTISGSGTSYTITLAQPIEQADRVTLTIGNATIATFTRELDVLPGDFNDDGVVNSQDLVGVRNEWLGIGGATYTIFGDINGDGVVNVTDYNDVRAFLGTSLPSTAPSNLLVNGDFSLGNTGFTSQYVYSTNLEPEDVYVVGANPHDFHPDGASFGDHTTGTGLMLIANGSPIANTVLWQETVNVANGANYVFSGWAASWGGGANGALLTDPSPAQLEFFVNGVQIGTEFTLNAQDGQWSQFSASWSSGTSNSATITIVDENTASDGNDFAVDDLAFGAGGAAPAAIASIGKNGAALAVPVGAVSTVSPAVNASPPASGVSLAPLVTAANLSVNTPSPPAQTVTISVSVHGGKTARRAAAAEARSMKRAEIRLANRGHRLNLENHRRELGSSTGKELKRL